MSKAQWPRSNHQGLPVHGVVILVEAMVAIMGSSLQENFFSMQGAFQSPCFALSAGMLSIITARF